MRPLSILGIIFIFYALTLPGYSLGQKFKTEDRWDQWDVGDLPHSKTSMDYYMFNRSTDPATVCFRASFNLSLYVLYYDTNDKLQTTYNNFTQNTTVYGYCGPEVTELILSWGGQNFTEHSLTFEFTTLPANESFPLESWAVDFITFKVNLNSTEFKNPKKELEMIVMTAENENHFRTPLNMSYTCQTHNKIVLDAYRHNSNGDKIDHAHIEEIYLDMWDVRIQPFTIDPHGEYSPGAPCELDLQEVNPFVSFVKSGGPDVVAAVVCMIVFGLVLVLVIAFVCFRKRSKSASYSAM